MTLAYSYIRWSSDRQTEGTSLERQTAAAAEYCKRHGLQLAEANYLDAGVSAFKGKNAAEGALKAFLDAVDEGKVSKNAYLLIENLDRLSRLPPRRALRLLEGILDRGVTVVTIKPEDKYTNADLDEDVFRLLRVLMDFERSHKESKRKSDLVSKAWSLNRQNWKPGDRLISKRGPAWLKANADVTGWIPLPEKVEIVQRIFKMAITTGQSRIVDVLNEEGVETMEDAQYWTQGVVGALLRSPAVKGDYVQKNGGERVIEGYFPAVVTKEQWLRVQSAVKARANTGGTKSDKVNNLFSALSRCMYCGSATRFVPTRKGHAYIHCLKAYSKGGCPARPFPYNAAETAILDRLMNVQQNRMDNTADDTTQEERILLTAEIDEQKRIQERAIQTQLIAGNVAALGETLKSIQAEIERLEQKREALTVDPISKQEWFEAQALFKKHYAMKEAGDPAVKEMRLAMQQALRRQLRKIEYGPEFQSSELYAKEGVKFFKEKRLKYAVPDDADFLIQLTFASGKVRLVSADPFINSRSKARREAARKAA